MQVLGIASLVAMGVVGSRVAVRLLLLARRSGELPERYLGLGLLLAALGGPVAALGRRPSWVATPLGDGLLGGGLAVTLAGIALFYLFTQRVFRPDAAWARWSVVAVAGVMGVEWLGMMQATSRGATMAEILPHTRPWGIAITGMVTGAFAWTAAESWIVYRRLRRRLRLGLADPLVANRLLLWTLSALGVVGLTGSVIASMASGLSPMQHPLPQTAIGAAALVVSVAWSLSFAPPARYAAWIERRAPLPTD